MNITEALTAHHATLRQLYDRSRNDPKGFDEFIRHLVVHHTMEEKYFYDLLREKQEGRHDALEAVNEHHIIEMILKDAERFPRDHERFPIKVEGLGEYTNHHLDEEETVIFPAAQNHFSAEALTMLGKLFLEAKDKLLGVALPQVPRELPPLAAARPPKPSGPAPEPATGRSGSDRERGETGKTQAIGLGIGSLKGTT